MRGLAALTVVFHHLLASTPEMWAVYEGKPLSTAAMLLGHGPLHLLWGGGEAVIVFFVLSGFVLSIPFWDGKPVAYLPFAVRRMCRLYPTYIVAVIIGFLALAAVSQYGLPGKSTWFGLYWAKPGSMEAFVDHLWVLASPRYNYVDPVIWSLAVEIQVSLAFPFLIACMRRAGWLAVPLALALSYAGLYLLAALPAAGDVLKSLLFTLGNAWLFVLGAELARNRVRIQRWAQASPASLRWLVLVVALALFNLRWQGGSALANGLLIPLGSAGLVAACAYFGELRPLLGSPPVQWLGKVSYSLYLIHFIVLFSLTHLLHPSSLALVLMIPASLAAAAFLHAAIERPSIAWGPVLGRRVAAWKAIA